VDKLNLTAGQFAWCLALNETPGFERTKTKCDATATTILKN